MPDREKVLDGLRHCLPETGIDAYLECDTCPYFKCDESVRLPVALVNDMRTLLIEQETEWVQISPAKIYECKVCGQTVMTDDIECYKFCHGCGRSVK